MTGRAPEISVVAATHNRSARLRELLAALRQQRLPRDQFEVVIVDNASTDETAALLAEEIERGQLDVHVIRREANAGPAIAREQGWRAARAPLIAFTDDDCAPQPEWLEAGLDAVRANPGAVVQGLTEPTPWERDRLGPFARTIRVPEAGPGFETCNIFYPREVLERIGGFDVVAFEHAVGGEDSDLGWRAIESGAGHAFAREALVYHAVDVIGPVGKLRVAARWTTPMLAYKRHPELRKAHFVKGIFWKGSHYLLIRALIGLTLPCRLRWLRPWFTGPYLLELRDRTRLEGGSLLLAPYLLVHDLVEIWAVGRAAVRYRHPML